MSGSSQHVTVAGSERTVLPGAQVVGAADPSARIEVTGQAITAAISSQLPLARRYLTPAELEATTGADPTPQPIARKNETCMNCASSALNDRDELQINEAFL